MFHGRQTAAVILAVLAGGGRLAFGSQEQPSRIETARQALKLFLDKKLPEFIDRGDATFKEKFTVAIGTGIWDRIHFKIGHFSAEESARLIREDGRDVLAVDPRAVFLLGHGMGGVVTPLIAQKDPQIAGVVLLATPARPMLNMIEDQLHYLVNFDQVISEKEQRELAAALEAIASVRAGDPKGSILNTPAMYWSRYEKLDSVRACLATKQPLLIVRGERDFQVTEEDTALWKNRLADRPGVEFRTYRRLNHLLMGGQGTGPSSPGEYSSPGKVSKDVVIETAQWILSRAPKPMPPAAAPEPAPAQPPSDPPPPEAASTP
ncbi:MAG: hypothetical protein FLDDKLPJ_01960 [Phycisphaerae bacterium]|nr:hypothetical protein [Phycisphaerae bacterium]